VVIPSDLLETYNSLLSFVDMGAAALLAATAMNLTILC